MSALCLVDTSILVEILNVPNKAKRHSDILAQYEEKVKNHEKFFLPLATIFETGNHIAQCGDGSRRRGCAHHFVHIVQSALKGNQEFTLIQFKQREHIQHWIDEFPGSAMRGSSLGDLSIVHDFHRICEQNRGRAVYIWSLDAHLRSHHQEPCL